MKALMRYKIISGRVVEKRDVLIEVSLDPTTLKHRPRGKRKGSSAAAQIERNRNEAVKTLARRLNCNCSPGDLLLTLKYNDMRLPETREDADRVMGNFIRRIQRAYKKLTGERLLIYAAVTAQFSSKTGKPVRLHHHLVIPAVAWEVIAKHWPSDQFSYRLLDGSGDYTGIADYMVRNAGYQRGKQTWTGSQNLKKPTFTAPEPVVEAGSFRVPKTANIVERVVREDQESGFRAAYIRYIMPAGQKDSDREGVSRHDKARTAGASCAGTSKRQKSAGGDEDAERGRSR